VLIILLLNYVWSNFTWEFYGTNISLVEPLTHAPSVAGPTDQLTAWPSQQKYHHEWLG
jgi:hypothetical protein